jgi:sugar phosphate permease
MRQRFYYGWVIVAVCATVAMLTAGTRAAPGAFLLSMEADTGYSKSTLSLAAGIALLMYGFGGPISGALMGRLGVRRVAALSVILTGLTLVMTSLSSQAWQFDIFFGLILGLSTGLVASSFTAMIANRWFVRHRGFVIGIFGASSSVGQLIFIPVLALIATTFGWRDGALVLGGVALVLLIPVALFLRESPASIGLAPLGAAAGSDAAKSTMQKPDPGVMRRAVRSTDFWLLAGTFFICGATSNGLVGQHFIAHAVDHNFSVQVASSALGVVGIFNFVGVLGSGWLTDRYDPRRLLLVYYVFRGLSLLYLPFIHDTLDITAFAVLFGLDFFASVPPTVALTADRFGRHNVGVVYGWIFASHMLGSSIAAVAAAVVRDNVGAYAPAFVVAGTLAVIGGFVVTTIKRTAKAPQVVAASAGTSA